MLEAGADPSIARKLDGLRPYDLLSRVARYGPGAVLAMRGSTAAQPEPGLFLSPAAQPVQGRWRRHAAELEERARRLDRQRRMFTAVALQLLLCRQRAAAASGGHPVGALPDELLFAILLSACTDHGQRAELQRRFEAVAAHLAMASKYERRSAALAARLPTGDRLSSSPADEEAWLQQLGEEYDAASAKLKQLRALKSKDAHAHGKAVRAVDAFVRAAEGVLYGGRSSEGEEDDGDVFFA